MKQENVYKSIINLLITNDFSESLSVENNKRLSQLIITALASGWEIPYDLIVKRVYRLNITDDGIDDKLLDLPGSVSEKLDATVINFSSVKVSNNITEHSVTAFRRQLMDDVKSAVDQRHANKKLNHKVDKYIETSLNKMRTKIYITMVTILGIFSAIVFSTFGGIQLLSNIFSNIVDMTKHDVGNTIFLSSIYLFGLSLILILLFVGLAKFVKGDKFSLSNEILPFGLVISGSAIFLTLIGLLGIVYSKFKLAVNLRILLVFFIAALGFFFYFVHSIKKKKQNKSNNQNKIK